MASILILGSGYTLRLATAALTPKSPVHSLGVLLVPGLLLYEQIAVVARSAYFQLWLNKEALTMVTWSCLGLTIVMCSM